MGTGALTRIYDWHGDLLVRIYRQSDGYPTGRGADVKKAIGDHVIVNGYNCNTPRPFANGMGCLAAQLIAALKVAPGNVSISPPGIEGHGGADFIYDIRGEYPGDRWDATSRPTLTLTRYDGRVLYEGPISSFDPRDRPTAAACEPSEDES